LWLFKFSIFITLRPILIRNNIIYAPYNVLSNWSNGGIASRHFFPKRLQIAALGVHPNQITMKIIMNTLSAYEQKNLNDWRRAHAECERMRQWVTENDCDVLDMCHGVWKSSASSACPRA
jgi:hypothetical protein